MSAEEEKFTGPNPDRFKVYEELEDATGFKLPDGKVFKYDKFHGWFDEYRNYYNEHGEPTTPPPDPSRFEEYEELPDGKGFKLPNGQIIEYDEFGGWYDEYDNYYNKDGQPDDIPIYEDPNWNYTEGDNKPNPRRFVVYTELEDGTGFRTPDGNEFKYDEFGGWYDERGFYYNQDGVPSEDPKKKN